MVHWIPGDITDYTLVQRLGDECRVYPLHLGKGPLTVVNVVRSVFNFVPEKGPTNFHQEQENTASKNAKCPDERSTAFSLPFWSTNISLPENNNLSWQIPSKLLICFLAILVFCHRFFANLDPSKSPTIDDSGQDDNEAPASCKLLLIQPGSSSSTKMPPPKHKNRIERS